jgi:hypothetical protein
MIKLKRKKFQQDFIWYVVKTLKARENYIIQGFIICNPSEMTRMTKWGTRLARQLS